MQLDQFLFMAEAEGMTDIVNTRTAKLNAMLNDLRKAPMQIYEFEDLRRMARQYNIDHFDTKDVHYLIDNY